MFKNDRDDFEKKWDEIKVFIEYGMLTEDKFLKKQKIFACIKIQTISTLHSTN